MPIHSYSCAKCSTEFEELFLTQSAVEREEKKLRCPKCKSVKKKRLAPKGTSFELKGRGWFKDGY